MSPGREHGPWAMVFASSLELGSGGRRAEVAWFLGRKVGVPVVADYLRILDWTGRQLAPGKRGRISPEAPAILATIDHDGTRWATRVTAFGSGWHRAAGSAQDLVVWPSGWDSSG